MKRHIKSSNQVVPEIFIEVTADHPILHVTHFDDDHVAATVDLSKYDLPDRPVISKDRNKVTQWMIDDFDGFVEDVELLCEEDYGLMLIYQNESNDNSHYYSYLATDEDGTVIAKLRLRLRISNHRPKRSKAQESHKKEELQSEKLHELLDEDQILKLRNYTKVIVVNNEIYDSYSEAFERVNDVIAHAVEVMKRGRHQ